MNRSAIEQQLRSAGIRIVAGKIRLSDAMRFVEALAEPKKPKDYESLGKGAKALWHDDMSKYHFALALKAKKAGDIAAYQRHEEEAYQHDMASLRLHPWG